MKQLLCFGDSNTWGWIPETHERYPWGVRWTSILQEKLRNDNIRVIEEGLNGRTSAFDDAWRENKNGLKALPLILETHAPLDAAVIMLGTNDCKAFFDLSPSQIVHGIELCIDKLLTVLPADRILLVSPIHLGEKVCEPGFDPEFNSKSVETSLGLYEEYRKLAVKKRLHIIAASDVAEPSDTDQEHMTPEGHAALAEAIYTSVVQMNILN